MHFHQEPEGVLGTALLLAELRHAGCSSGEEADDHKCLDVDRKKPAYTAPAEEEMIEAVSRLDKEDNELIADKHVLPSHSEVHMLSTGIWWL